MAEAGYSASNAGRFEAAVSTGGNQGPVINFAPPPSAISKLSSTALATVAIVFFVVVGAVVYFWKRG